jgi:hypothetical protein
MTANFMSKHSNFQLNGLSLQDAVKVDEDCESV